jgi:hypothetical protein
MRRELTRTNEMLRASRIGLAGVAGQVATVGDVPVNLGQDQFHRVFNRGSFGLGGRLYGPFWQSLPKEIRERLVIDSKATSESDYGQLHPRLLYAEAAAVLGGDAYEIDGWGRPLVKRAFNIAVNAYTEAAAVRAIAQEIGGQGAHTKASELLQAIRAKHQPIAGYFGSGAGLRLQRRDADLAQRVMLRLYEQNIVVLSIHDSFITKARHAPSRDQAMDDELKKLLAKLAPTTRMIVPSGTYAESVPHNGIDIAAGPPGCPPLVLLVSERAFTFGGLAPFEVSTSSLTAWADGVAPEPVRLALRHEIAARGITQGCLAREIGLSRPQLTNVLRGRFGASPQVAARLKAFLLAEHSMSASWRPTDGLAP